MDVGAIVAILAPAFPFLLGLGGKAAESAAEKMGEDTWEKAKKLWEKFRPEVEAKPLAQGAVQELAKNPDDGEARELLARQLGKFLADDRDLAKAIAEIMGQGSPTAIQQTVMGEKNQTIGQVLGGKVIGNVEGNVTI